MISAWTAHALEQLAKRYDLRPNIDMLEEKSTYLRLRFPPYAKGPAVIKKRVFMFGKWMRLVYDRNAARVMTVLPDGTEEKSGSTFKLKQYLKKEGA